MNAIVDFTKNLWCSSRKTKQTATRWISGNAVCCAHNGESEDKRGRGGLIVNGGSLTYRCFNCNWLCSFKPGYHLSFKFRKFLSWMGANDNDIQRLVIEAIRIKDQLLITEPATIVKEEVHFTPVPLPMGARSFDSLITAYPDNIGQDLLDCISYINGRQIHYGKYEFYWCPDKVHRMRRRVIIPLTWENQIVGYTARSIDDDLLPKYYMQVDSHYVFNVDKQKKDSKFVIVCEGPFDAMSIDGVAVMHNEINEQQIDIIDALGKEVIVVPDNDRSGAKIIKHAIECGWNVAFPIWFDGPDACKDINDAVCKYGKLFVLKSIIAAKESSPLKIELLTKRLNKA